MKEYHSICGDSYVCLFMIVYVLVRKYDNCAGSESADPFPV